MPKSVTRKRQNPAQASLKAPSKAGTTAAKVPSMKRTKRKLTPRLGADASCAVTRRKAGPMKHRNAPRKGSKKSNHLEGWES